MSIHRRCFLGGAAAAMAHAAAAGKEHTYRFGTAEAEIEMAIEFHDGHASHGFWFRGQKPDRSFCLSADGEEGRHCLSAFRGSLAIARYRVRARAQAAAKLVLRESVRTIDRDTRLPDRPPFERAIALKKGVGSDLQAFGYEPKPEEGAFTDRHGPWYLFRQDLYLEPQSAPFLVLYWKHALTSIRVLDLIPGDQTWVEKR